MTTEDFAAMTFPEMTSLRRSLSTLACKRCLDLCLALAVGLLFLPIFLVLAIAIRLDSPGPVLFIQDRRGEHFRMFRMFKFRSLHHRAPDPRAQYEMQEDDPRITRVGAFIRHTSLDELPQLLNVILGDMSLIGPRPLVDWESRQCLLRHGARFLVKPGITGLSQISVRNGVDLDDRSDKDVEYVQRWSLGLDLRILCLTPRVLISGRGIYPAPKSQG